MVECLPSMGLILTGEPCRFDKNIYYITDKQKENKQVFVFSFCKDAHTHVHPQFLDIIKRDLRSY